MCAAQAECVPGYFGPLTSIVGVELGPNVGVPDGPTDGTIDGVSKLNSSSVVGGTVGTFEGMIVGGALGVIDGDCVGVGDGASPEHRAADSTCTAHVHAHEGACADAGVMHGCGCGRACLDA